MVTATATTFSRPIIPLQFTLGGQLVPVVTDYGDRHGELLDELDSLISDLESALVDRDTAARRVTIVAERLALVRAALEAELLDRRV
jgi:hypothetical protein